jgi:hypothetical protein
MLPMRASRSVSRLYALREQLKRGAKSFVCNKGFRRYLKTEVAKFEIDEDKVRE